MAAEQAARDSLHAMRGRNEERTLCEEVGSVWSHEQEASEANLDRGRRGDFSSLSLARCGSDDSNNVENCCLGSPRASIEIKRKSHGTSMIIANKIDVGRFRALRVVLGTLQNTLRSYSGNSVHAGPFQYCTGHSNNHWERLPCSARPVRSVFGPIACSKRASEEF